MITITSVGSTARTHGGSAFFAMPMGAPGVGVPTPSVPVSPVPQGKEHGEHHGWWYAAIALIGAALVLGILGAIQYARVNETAPTVTSAVPAEFAGVSVPQAMRLSDLAGSSVVPAEFAGVSVPQAMRLSDLAGSSVVPAEFAGVSLPQAMRLSDLAATSR